MDYRVREARIEVCNGYRCWHERRFVAERRVRFLGVLSWWWPVIDCEWRTTAQEARTDAEKDSKLRAPLTPHEFFHSN